jgi:hypothetical protein
VKFAQDLDGQEFLACPEFGNTEKYQWLRSGQKYSLLTAERRVPSRRLLH